MDFATIIVPAAPVRRKARHQSEMTNQLLFGENVEIIKGKGSLWVKIRSLHDGYEGWMTNTLLQEVSEEEAKSYCPHVTSCMVNSIQINQMKMNVPLGSSLPRFHEGNGVINTVSFQLDGHFNRRNEQMPGKELIKQLGFQW